MRETTTRRTTNTIEDGTFIFHKEWKGFIGDSFTDTLTGYGSANTEYTKTKTSTQWKAETGVTWTNTGSGKLKLTETSGPSGWAYFKG